jgi:hypothetical protein
MKKLLELAKKSTTEERSPIGTAIDGEVALWGALLRFLTLVVGLLLMAKFFPNLIEGFWPFATLMTVVMLGSIPIQLYVVHRLKQRAAAAAPKYYVAQWLS